MILVTLGTQDKKFNRLLEEIDKLILDKKIKDEVVVQAGFSKDYKSDNMKIFELISKVEFDDLIEKCDILITHGGVGAILTGLKYNKKVIAIPRLKKYKEHVNDHQIQIVSNFHDEGYIVGINEVEELENAINKIKDFCPRKYKSNKNNMVKLVKELIDK